MLYIDGNKIREKSMAGQVICVIDGDKIREKSMAGSIIAKMDDVRNAFKNPIGGKTLVAVWIAFVR